jgi:hypothetical protein
MPNQHERLARALSECGPNVVLAESLEQGCAGQPGQDRDVEQGKREGWKDEVGQASRPEGR